MKTTLNKIDLDRALELVNEHYDGNIEYKDVNELNGRKWQTNFTLKAKDSRGKGGRINHTGRRVGNAACWHVHGHLFTAIFSIDPMAEVMSGGRKITALEGNWEDRNIGSLFQPMYYSEACDCAGSSLADRSLCDFDPDELVIHEIERIETT